MSQPLGIPRGRAATTSSTTSHLLDSHLLNRSPETLPSLLQNTRVPHVQGKARDTLARKTSLTSKKITDELYAGCLTLRSEPVSSFLGDTPKWKLPVTSIREDELLKLLGLPKSERNQIQGLQTGVSSASVIVRGD
eukprot:7375905-Prymnesium_polylepis.1